MGQPIEPLEVVPWLVFSLPLYHSPAPHVPSISAGITRPFAEGAGGASVKRMVCNTPARMEIALHEPDFSRFATYRDKNEGSSLGRYTTADGEEEKRKRGGNAGEGHCMKMYLDTSKISASNQAMVHVGSPSILQWPSPRFSTDGWAH